MRSSPAICATDPGRFPDRAEPAFSTPQGDLPSANAEPVIGTQVVAGAIAYIALGSNRGDRAAMLQGAIGSLQATPGIAVLAVSTFHETEPVGGPPGQGKYLNAAASLETTLEPLELLHALQAIEAQFGRVRTERWGERTLDLDLLLFGEEIIDAPELSVPHPRLTTRRFVLEPLNEIAPRAVHPGTHRTIAELLAHLDRADG